MVKQNIVFGLKENSIGNKVSEQIEGILANSVSFDIGTVTCVNSKDEFDDCVASEDYSMGVILEKIDETPIGQGAIKAWSRTNPNMRIILVMSDDKLTSAKPGGLYDRGYYNGLFNKDFCQEEMYKLLEKDRTAEEAFLYYKLNEKEDLNGSEDKQALKESTTPVQTESFPKGEVMEPVSEEEKESQNYKSEENELHVQPNNLDEYEIQETESKKPSSEIYLIDEKEEDDGRVLERLEDEEFLSKYIEGAVELVQDDRTLDERDRISEDLEELFKSVLMVFSNLKEVVLEKALTTGNIDGFIDEAYNYIHEAEGYSSDIKKKCYEMVCDFTLGFDVLSKLISIDDITTIHVTDYDKVRVKVKGKRKTSTVSFISRNHYLRFLKNIKLRYADNELIEGTTSIYTDRNYSSEYFFQISIIDGATSSTGIPELIIRKFSQNKMALKKMIGEKLTIKSAALIINSIKEGKGILMFGGSECGGTTLLNTMLDFIPRDKSGIVIQHKDELSVGVHPELTVKHPTMDVKKDDGTVIRKGRTVQQLAREALNSDTDYYILADVRGDEAYSLFSACNSGFIPWTTVKASSYEEAFNSLANSIIVAEPALDKEKVSMLVAQRFEIVIYMNKLKVVSIYKSLGYNPQTKKYEVQKII